MGNPVHEVQGTRLAERSGFERALDTVVFVSNFVSGSLMVILIVIFGWLVWGRYVLNSTPTWVEQAALVIVIYIAFLGAAVGTRNGTHLSIDFIREAMPPLPRLILHIIAELLMVLFGIFMAWQGWGLVMTNLTREIPMLGLTESWRAAPLVICGVMIVLFSAVNLLRAARAPHREE